MRGAETPPKERGGLCNQLFQAANAATGQVFVASINEMHTVLRSYFPRLGKPFQVIGCGHAGCCATEIYDFEIVKPLHKELLKGTVARDFLPLLFPIKRTYLGP